MEEGDHQGRHTRDALIRFAGTQVNTAVVLNFRIDADYAKPVMKSLVVELVP